MKKESGHTRMRAAAKLKAKLSAQRYAVKEYFPVHAVRRQDRCLVAFELERDPHFGAIGFDLPFVELHVQLDNLRDSQISQRFARSLHGGFGRLVPGLGAGS